MAISKEKKNEIIAQYARHEGDTGSVEVQVAVLTWEINHLNEHIKQHKKGPRNLPWIDEKKVGHRRNLLAYLRRTDVNRYRELIASLGLRTLIRRPSQLKASWIFQGAFCIFQNDFSFKMVNFTKMKTNNNNLEMIK